MPKLYQMTEEKVAGQIGISRERIREIRLNHLLLGTHFEKTAAGIVYTQDGVEAAMAAISARVVDVLARIEEKKTPEIPQAPILHTLRILKTFPNPTWVKGQTESGEIVQCRVRSNISMRVGTILAKCERQADGKFVCRGRF